jgi:hypothetical protein
VAVTRANGLVAIVLYTLAAAGVEAAVLAEDRVDAMYHSYDGGGLEVDGPSILVRKGLNNSVSASAGYYVDSISSATIDVVTQGSPYDEERTQYSLGIDYLYDKSIMSYAYITSTENDFDAETSSFHISQEMFGGLTTVTLGYSIGDNLITKSTDSTFRRNSSSKSYRVSLSQVANKNLLLGLTYEIITDTGFLNNPYRQVRYLDGNGGTAYQPEVYPNTRTSNAASVSFRRFLSYGAAVYGGYRFFTDTWDIRANTFELGYTHPFREQWLFDISLRVYSQDGASFFSSLFPFVNAQNYLASDKELSTFTNNSLGLGMTYDISRDHLYAFDRGTFNFYFNYFFYDYEDFLNTTVTGVPPGSEPAYSFSASVIRMYFSLWF